MIEDFKREDIAKAWLLTHLNDIAMTTTLAISKYNLKHVFVAGSLANREFVRKHLTREMTRADQRMAMLGQQVVNLSIVQYLKDNV